ncbi:hypothetical protein BV22DRAFT_171209 [Leucogyrophana mollusca]|uniref:Uncharacterized protein n=1 Tax=Leucogyrophana mollusca TaxID=85980 RepID=A0ACB8BTI5_9AGAM|nr:hypothetical protein BV22DRAFT_171209 [Leucogyrophana mollusca]
MLNKSTTIFIAAVVAAVAQAAEVQWFTSRSCDGGSALDYRNVACNTCIDPDGDWYAVEVTGIGSNQAVTAHNQHGCTSSSVVGQQYGNICLEAGNTALRSVYVAC